MRQMTALRRPQSPLRDPAPSRLGYRYQRLMLTPGFRLFVRIGVPLIVIAALAGSWLAKPDNRALLEGQVAQVKQNFQERPQFMVQSLLLTGGDAALQSRVAALLPDNFPVSSFQLDLETMRQTIEALAAVRSARVRLGEGGALEVALIPRVPAALWRDGQTLRLIDADGVPAGTVDARSDRLDLPLIAGDGAEQNIAEALALYARAGPLRDRVRGLVRIGQRRWDIILDRDQRLLLPGADAPAALDRIIALNAAQDMLERDVAIVDMRKASRPTLRMNAEAAAAMRRVNEIQITNGANN
ncbi:cell division protein FtsQ/DivIB [Yoonia sp.]|uniref:cell division protein FtsQ/DivIB n=1 Tax=Yoonia sp. TaxID=2212373 RepID=UPI0019F8008A|nr:cell division protein FtsQ/DivIB [Yoonia sp.]MBE0413549.1 cell division protein FtsQ/DivIB [Yoonia sp.]